MDDSNTRHGQTQASDLSESDPSGTEIPTSPAKETTRKKKKRGSWAFWRSGNKEQDAQQDSSVPESPAPDDPLALLNQAETTDDMACAIDQLFANSAADTRDDDLVFDAEEIATSINFEEESPVTREINPDNTRQEPRSRGRGSRRREDRDDGRDGQNRNSGRRSRNDRGERSRDDRGDRSRDDRGDRSRDDRGDRSRDDRGDRSRDDRGDRSRDDRGGRSRDDRGDRSRNDRGDRSRDDRGDRSRDDRGDPRSERSDRRDEGSQNSRQRQNARGREKPSRPPIDHGDVPTWDTAVSFVVDNNMLTRDQKTNRNRKSRSRPRKNSQD